MVCQCLVGCGTSVHNSREIIILVLVAAYVLATHSEGILSATDVLVRMLMKGAAKCNNHCELQNSVNQLTIERRSALGAFLRACLCQSFHTLSGGCSLLGHADCASSVMLVALSVVAATSGACYLRCYAHPCLVRHMNMTSSKATC